MRFIANKLGRVASCGDFPYAWANSHLQAPNVVVLEDRVRVYFTTRTHDGIGFVSRPGYFDLNPRNLRELLGKSAEPCLDTGPLGSFDMYGVYPASVMLHQGSFLMAYGGWSRPKDVEFDVAIGLARSSRGSKFERVFTGPIIGKSQREPFVLSSPKLRYFESKFHMFYIAGESWSMGQGRTEPIYKIRHASSTDLAVWDRSLRDIVPEKIPSESQASPDVFWLGDRFHMFFSHRGSLDYRTGTSAYRMGYAYSKDLVTWLRADDRFSLDVSESGWDSEMVAYPSFFSIGENLFVAYVGNGVGETGIGIAKLEVISDDMA